MPRLNLSFDDGEFLRLRQAAKSDGVKPTTWAGAQVRKAIPPFELEVIEGAEQTDAFHPRSRIANGVVPRTRAKGKSRARQHSRTR